MDVKKTVEIYDLIIIGSGPSGIMCAIKASKKFNSVLIIDINDRPLLRLLASGGGRCNVSNTLNKKEFIKGIVKGWDFISKSFNNFNNIHVRDYFEESGVYLKVENGKYLFPDSDDSQEIADRLLASIDWNKTAYESDVVEDVKLNNNFFSVVASRNTWRSKRLVIATGGQSYKRLGTSGLCEKICNDFSIKYSNKYIACNVPLRTRVVEKSLQGVSIASVTISYGNNVLEGPILFTHFGLSGPAVIRMSCNINSFPAILKVNFINKNFSSFFEEFKRECKSNPTKKIYNNLIQVSKLPISLCKYICEFSEETSANLRDEKIKEICMKVTNYNFEITSKMSMDIAFTTSGGVQLEEINPQNMESYKVKNLYFIGECLDIVAYTGGYNISTWFSLGYTCGKEML
jgi:predicted Rossmann fold flavoprotein